MNIKQKPKIDLFLGGLAERFKENGAYFEGITFTVKSGIKKYTGGIDKDLVFTFVGKQTFKTIEDALDRLADEVIKHDSAEIEYKERGMVTLITADDKGVKSSRKESASESIEVSPLLKDKEYILNPQKAAPLLTELGFLTPEGKLRNDMIRKYNQTDRFLSLTSDIFEEYKSLFGEREILIIDCACGKSYLSFVLNCYLWEILHIKARFIGIDISEQVIKDSREKAKRFGYSNMEFINQDLRTYVPKTPPDMVISLHACDTATDMALGLAIRSGAKAIACVPCCHKELLDKYKKPDLDQIIKHGIFRARLNDILTDGIRTAKLESEGYNVTCVEYCSPLDTPKNLLIKAIKTKESGDKKAYGDLVKLLDVYPAIEKYSSVSLLEDLQ